MRTPLRARSSAPSIAGRRSDSSTMRTPLRSATSCAWPNSPKPVTSVTALRRERPEHVGSLLVQRAHPADRALERLRAGDAALDAGHDQAGAERLRQEERVAGPRAALRPDVVRMNGADDGEPVLRLGVANRVSAREQPARLAHLRVGGGEDLGEHLDRQLLGERGDREREQRRASHREHVVQRVRRGDRAVVAGIVDDRREEVEREDDRALVVDAIDRGVVRRREPDEQVLRLDGNEALEQFLETRRRVLRRAAAARGQIREPHSSDVGAQRILLAEWQRNSRVREPSRLERSLVRSDSLRAKRQRRPAAPPLSIQGRGEARSCGLDCAVRL